MPVDASEPSWIHLLIPACIIGFFFVLVVAAGLWEKRRILAYSLPEPDREYPCTPYGLQRNREVKKLGYRYGGVYHDARGSIYKCRYDFWLSPDSTILVWIGCGTVARLAAKSVNLISQLEGGRYLQTTDMTGETDLSGLTDLQIWPKQTFRKLVDRHNARLEALGASALPFSDAPMRDVINIRRVRALRLVEQGDAKYVDDNESIWKYTLKGALRFYFVATWLQTFRRGLRKIGVS